MARSVSLQTIRSLLYEAIHNFIQITYLFTLNISRLILGLRPANERRHGLRPAKERRRYKVAPSLIGWRKPGFSPAFDKPVPFQILLDLLGERGMPLNDQDTNGRTALQLSLMFKFYEMSMYLLSKNISPWFSARLQYLLEVLWHSLRAFS